jgi:hypothetical protein
MRKQCSLAFIILRGAGHEHSNFFTRTLPRQSSSTCSRPHSLKVIDRIDRYNVIQSKYTISALHSSPTLALYTGRLPCLHQQRHYTAPTAQLTSLQRYLANKQYFLNKIYKYIKILQTLTLVEWASSTSPQPPKPDRILNHKQSQNTSFTYDVPRRSLNLCYPAGPRRPRSAGRPTPPKSKSSPQKPKSECPLTTKGKPTKTRNVHAHLPFTFPLQPIVGRQPCGRKF